MLIIQLWLRAQLKRLARLWAWLWDNPWRWSIVIIVGLGIALWWQGGKLADARSALDAEIAAHDATVANYDKAAADALQADIDNAARFKREADAKIQEVVIAYEKDNANLRANLAARLSRVRNNAGSEGGPDATSLPRVSDMPPGLVPNAGEAIVSIRDLEIAADNYAQLVALIAAWDAMHGVPVSAGP